MQVKRAIISAFSLQSALQRRSGGVDFCSTSDPLTEQGDEYVPAIDILY
jgi:hypothetical protein